MPAPLELMNDLHSLVCNELIKAVKEGNMAGISQAIKFLKDNKVEAALEYSKELQELAEDFPFDNVVNFK